jgi:hypothetical protein
MTKNAMEKSLEPAKKLNGQELCAVRGGFGAGHTDNGNANPQGNP